MEVFIHLFAFEMGYANVKVVQWLDQMYYIFLGIMTSGYVYTSHGDTKSLILVIRLVLIILLLAMNIKNPFSYWNVFGLGVYGDDTVLGAPLHFEQMFGNVNGVPVHLVSEFQKLGLTLKPKETNIFVPKPGHIDRFFTLIENDEVVSSGVHFLQRYFVKYDQDMNPVHPDKPAMYVFPWRHAGRIISKSALDPHNWTSFGPHPIASAYAKAFGLLMDAGPNRVAHNYLRNIMEAYLSVDADADYKAKYLSSKGYYKEYILKLGQFNPSFITDLKTMSYNESYFWVVNHMHISPFAFQYKNPTMRVVDYRKESAPEFVSQYSSTISTFFGLDGKQRAGLVTSRWFKKL